MIDDKTDDKNKKSYSLSFRYRWFWIVFLILFIGWEWRWRWRWCWCWWDNSDGYWYRYGDSCCVWKALRRYLKSTQGKTIYIYCSSCCVVRGDLLLDLAECQRTLCGIPYFFQRTHATDDVLFLDMIDHSTVVRGGGKRVRPGATQKEWARSSSIDYPSIFDSIRYSLPPLLKNNIIRIESIVFLFLLYEIVENKER